MKKFFTTLMISLAAVASAFSANTTLKVGDDFSTSGTNLLWYYITSMEPGKETVAVRPHYYPDGYWYDKVIPETVTYEGVKFTVTAIMDGAFMECEHLESVVIPETVTYIGESAFQFCYMLKEVTIPKSVTEFGQSVFAFSRDLENIYVEEGSPILTSIDGVLYNKDMTTLLQVPAMKESVNLPSSVTYFDMSCLSNCSRLATITIPKGTEILEIGAFQDCTGLESIVIPGNISEIRNWCFDGCTSLSNIKFEEGLTSIRSAAFQSCSSLTEISFPETLQYIGQGAFNGCLLLEKVYVGEQIEEIDNLAFQTCKNLREFRIAASTPPVTDTLAFDDTNISAATLYVPKGSEEAYAEVKPWSDFGKIEGVEFTAVNEVAGAEGLTVNAAAGYLSIDSESPVAIYNIAGAKVAEGEGHLEFTLPAGIYVVANATRTVKVAL